MIYFNELASMIVEMGKSEIWRTTGGQAGHFQAGAEDAHLRQNFSFLKETVFALRPFN